MSNDNLIMTPKESSTKCYVPNGYVVHQASIELCVSLLGKFPDASQWEDQKAYQNAKRFSGLFSREIPSKLLEELGFISKPSSIPAIPTPEDPEDEIVRLCSEAMSHGRPYCSCMNHVEYIDLVEVV